MQSLNHHEVKYRVGYLLEYRFNMLSLTNYSLIPLFTT